MPDNKLTETQAENLIEAITNAIMADQQDFDSIMRRYNVTADDFHEYIDLIEGIHTNLIPHQPDETFVSDLRADLLGTTAQTPLKRFPMRARLATILAAVLAATVWVARRRNTDSSVSDVFEEVSVR